MNEILTKIKKFSKEHRNVSILLTVTIVILLFFLGGFAINQFALLEAQAEPTGTPTEPDIFNELTYGTIIGADTNNNSKIDTVKVTTSLAAGSKPINLDKVEYKIRTSKGTTTISLQNDAITTKPIEVDDNQTVLSTSTEKIQLQIDLSKLDSINELEENDIGSLRTITQYDTTSATRFEIPRNLYKGEGYIIG